MKVNLIYKYVLAIALFALAALMNGCHGGVITGRVLSDETTYPYHFTYKGNPLVRNHGAADPDVNVWDGVVWMYCSQDHIVSFNQHY